MKRKFTVEAEGFVNGRLPMTEDECCIFVAHCSSHGSLIAANPIYT